MNAVSPRPLTITVLLGLAVGPAVAAGQVVVGPGPVVMERSVVVPARPRLGLGLGSGPFIGSPFGQRRVFVARPAIVATPTAVVVEPPPPVVVSRPAVVIDPYQDAIGRLRSKHNNSRRDGALTLGRLGDPRAVPDLVWLLQNDRIPNVREASAYALGAIGDARSMNALRVAAMTDRNRKVRQAANHAHGKIAFAAPVVTTSGPVETIIETSPVIESAPVIESSPLRVRAVEPRRPVDVQVAPATEPALEPVPEPYFAAPRATEPPPRPDSPPAPLPPPAAEIDEAEASDPLPPAALPPLESPR